MILFNTEIAACAMLDETGEHAEYFTALL